MSGSGSDSVSGSGLRFGYRVWDSRVGSGPKVETEEQSPSHPLLPTTRTGHMKYNAYVTLYIPYEAPKEWMDKTLRIYIFYLHTCLYIN